MLFRCSLSSLVTSTLACCAVLASSGCKENPFLQNPALLQGQVRNMQQQQATLAQQGRELESRAQMLDKNNQELETLLAQSRQRSQILEDQLAAVQDQLRNTGNQLAQTRLEKENTEKKAQSLLASLQRRSEATITANNSLIGDLPLIQMPGVEVRRDGDVIRIELPTDKLFEPGTYRFRPEAATLLDAVAAEVAHHYPGHRIGIEGHTSADPSGVFQPGAHPLTLGQASAVFDHLSGRGVFSPSQLFVAAHGANHPVVSNGTSAGQTRNRRVELVVYPEKVQGP